jgi:hypothetical protein
VAISTALTLGSSYICTSTKDLQSQYARDFSFVRVAKGKSNFPCEVKDDAEITLTDVGRVVDFNWAVFIQRLSMVRV